MKLDLVGVTTGTVNPAQQLCAKFTNINSHPSWHLLKIYKKI
jgi:hypothetical protein